MNTPNKLTCLRIILIPFFVFFLLVPSIPQNYLWALILFGAASFTDYLDGHLARKYNLITSFGKLMDPLADKLMVTAAIVCFVQLRLTSALVVIIILAREFLVTSLRLVAAGNGVVIAADKYGKYKTVSQIIWICYVLLFQWLAVNLLPAQLAGAYSALMMVGHVMAAIVLVLTVYSGWNYLWKNRSCFSEK